MATAAVPTPSTVLASGTSEIARKPALERLISNSCVLNDDGREFLRAKFAQGGTISPEGLTLERQRQVSAFINELKAIQNHPVANANVKAFVGAVESKAHVIGIAPVSVNTLQVHRPTAPNGEPPKAIAAKEAVAQPKPPAPNPTVPKSLTLQRTQVISMRGLAGKLLKYSGVLSTAIAILKPDAAWGSMGDDFLTSDENFRKFFELPLEEQKRLMESNQALERTVKEYYENSTTRLGGSPNNLKCEPQQSVFTNNGSGPQATHRTFTILKNAADSIQEIIVKEYNGTKSLYEARLEFAEGKMVRITPSFPSGSRVLKKLNRPYSPDEFKGVAANIEDIGVGTFIHDLYYTDLYLGLIDQQLSECADKIENPIEHWNAPTTM